MAPAQQFQVVLGHQGHERRRRALLVCGLAATMCATLVLVTGQGDERSGHHGYGLVQIGGGASSPPTSLAQLQKEVMARREAQHAQSLASGPANVLPKNQATVPPTQLAGPPPLATSRAGQAQAPAVQMQQQQQQQPQQYYAQRPVQYNQNLYQPYPQGQQAQQPVYAADQTQQYYVQPHAYPGQYPQQPQQQALSQAPQQAISQMPPLQAASHERVLEGEGQMMAKTAASSSSGRTAAQPSIVNNNDKDFGFQGRLFKLFTSASPAAPPETAAVAPRSMQMQQLGPGPATTAATTAEASPRSAVPTVAQLISSDVSSLTGGDSGRRSTADTADRGLFALWKSAGEPPVAPKAKGGETSGEGGKARSASTSENTYDAYGIPMGGAAVPV